MLAYVRLWRGYPWRRELLQGLRKGWFPAFLPYPVDPTPRYGYGKPPHRRIYELFEAGREVWAERLTRILRHRAELGAVAVEALPGSLEPAWSNRWFSGLDAAALYCFLADGQPRRYLEIGSGNSTRFARRAIRDHGLATRVVSLDPEPRIEVDAIADQVVRRPLEPADLGIFDDLEPGDVLSFDGSHFCLMNSDVTVFFLEVLPRLAAGVVVHIHDIHLPYDYPPARAALYESEQYLVGVLLQTPDSGFEVLLPNRFVAEDASLSSILAELWTFPRPDIFDCSLWLRKL